MSCGVGHRCTLDPALPWLWNRLTATAPIQLLAWELSYATGAALKSKKKKQQQQKKKKTGTRCADRLKPGEADPTLVLGTIRHSQHFILFDLRE